MRIVFAGTPEFAVPSLHSLIDAGHEVLGVITREDAPLGRKRVLTASPVAVAAEARGIPVLKANRLDDAATEWVARLAPELGVIVAYGGLVREPLLALPTLGWINLHFSDLPRWRGAAPVQRALEAGESTLGVTVFRLVAALDAGDVLTRDAFDVAPGTAAGSALSMLAASGADTLLRAVDALAADPQAGEPQVGEPSYAHKLSRADGALDLTQPAASVLAKWAGMTPEPGAYVETDGAVLKVLDMRRPQTDPPGEASPPGSVRLVDGVAYLQLTDAALELVRVQPAGKAAMDATAWLRGRSGLVVL